MIRLILSILSGALSIYTLICFVYIIMSWLPGVKFTKFGRVVSSICEPYMNLFSRRGWFRFGNIDFSPILSIGLLSVASSVLSGIQATGRIWFGYILGTIVSLLWNIISTLLTLFTILILVRWIVLLINHGQTSYNSIWNQIDGMLNNVVYKISGTFVKKNHNYQTSLLISWITLIIISIVTGLLIKLLIHLCLSIPF